MASGLKAICKDASIKPMKCLRSTFFSLTLILANLAWSLSLGLSATSGLLASPATSVRGIESIDCTPRVSASPGYVASRTGRIASVILKPCDPSNPNGCVDEPNNPSASSPPCDSQNKNGCVADPPRGSIANPNTSYIISPSDTALLGDKPSISWHGLPDATSYTIRLTEIAGRGLLWQRTIDRPPNGSWDEIRMPYPNDAPPLQPGKEYKLIVQARFRSIEKRIEPGEAKFRMLNQEELQSVREKVEQIEKLNLPKEDKALQHLYNIYLEQNLVAETKEMLESLVAEGTQNPKIFRFLGNLYQQQGLLDLSRIRYERAIQLALKAGNAEELEAAKKSLDEIDTWLKQQNDRTF